MSYNRLTTQSLFDEEAAGYYRRNYETPRSRHAYNLHTRRLICLSLVEPHHKTILDLGCGPGAMSLPLLRAGREVYGIDLSKEMVAQAVELARETPSPYSFSVGDATELPYQDGFFDLVISTGVLEYIPNPRLALSEVTRVLKPGGALVMTVPTKQQAERCAGRALRLLRGLRKSGGRREGAEVWHRQYRPGTFDRLLADAGLVINERVYSYFVPFPLDAILPGSVKALDAKLGAALKGVGLQRALAKTYIVKATRAS